MPPLYIPDWSGIWLRAGVVGTTATAPTYYLYDSEQLAQPFCSSTPLPPIYKMTILIPISSYTMREQSLQDHPLF